MALQPTIAASQDAIAPPPAVAEVQPTPPEDDAENTGADFARPLNLFQLTYSYRTAPGSGAEQGTIRDVTTDTVDLRADQRIDLGSQWTLGLRADLPFLAKNPINSSNPDGDYLYGVGDADAQAALIYKFDTRWSAGFGARLIVPTGSDVIASGKWQIMPAFGVRYSLPEVSEGSYFRASALVRRQFRRRPLEEEYQQSAIRADTQPSPPGSLVRHVVPERRHPGKLRRRGHGSDRAAVPSLRREGWP